MSSIEPNIATIGIVGGGQGGLQMLELFLKSDKVKVNYVVDRYSEAPAALAAKSAGVEVIPDLNIALTTKSADYIIEVTGSDTVAQMIRDGLPSNSHLIHHKVALFLFSILMDESRRGVVTQVESEIIQIKNLLEQNLDGINTIVTDIDDMTSELNMLSLNARIEAARAGDQGKGFAVVAVEVGKSAEAVQKMAKEISRISNDMMKISNSIDNSIQRLH